MGKMGILWVVVGQQIDIYCQSLFCFGKLRKMKKKNTKEIFNKKYAIIIVGSIPIYLGRNKTGF